MYYRLPKRISSIYGTVGDFLRLLNNKVLKKQLFRYIITGGSAFLIEYLLYLLLIKIVGIDYAIASVVIYILLFIATFVATRKWTFESDGNPKRQLILYLLLVLFNAYVGNYVLMKWLVGAGIPKEIAPFFKTGAITMWNFVVYKFIIYK